MGARLIAVSGLGPKEPAAFVVETNGQRLLLDCGEGPEPGRLPDVDAIGVIDAIILSHGHNDHSGALRLRELIGSPPVYATAPVITRLPAGIAAQPIPIRGHVKVRDIAIEAGLDGHAPGGVWLRLAVGEGLLTWGPFDRVRALWVRSAARDRHHDLRCVLRRAGETQARHAPTWRTWPRTPPCCCRSRRTGAGPRSRCSCSRPGRCGDRRASPRCRDPAHAGRLHVGETRRRSGVGAADPHGAPARRGCAAQGVMVAHGGSGDAGIAAALIGAGASRAIPRSRSPAISPRHDPTRWWINAAPSSGAGTCTDILAKSAIDRERQSAPRGAGLRRHPLPPALAPSLAPRQVITSPVVEL